jgi:DNA-binding CsgD family transcriptional regulator
MILEGIINGKSYQALADDMFITLDTVRFHIKKVYELLQVHSRFELIMKFKK